eukprot:gnl/TRDRNA2_/TRDRNA2_63634_c1_seq1.p1 gnl/TRDRNA2_/TRDRNA2_63634_c1~~gnl/TRDRNA2_/TRDRNA2_63634_c1_seq1.p1  ORF type:complete len:126 (-),score=13.97 gnl/TRDRNA2_/TRDRNA2_63634_c1_seq1:345-722(-)
MVGFAKDDWNLNRRQHPSFLEHAVHVSYDGNVSVYEQGSQLDHTVCRFDPGEEVSLIKNEDGVIEYKLQGHTFYTSGLPAIENMRVKVCVHNVGSFATSFRWVNRRNDRATNGVVMKEQRLSVDT